MDFEEALYAALVADGRVGALVSTRVYPQVIPQDVDLPAIAYQKISGPRWTSHDGALGLVATRMQLTCTAESYADAKAVFHAVRELLSGFRGMLGASATAPGVWVVRSALDNEIDGYNLATGRQTVRCDLNVIYRE